MTGVSRYKNIQNIYAFENHAGLGHSPNKVHSEKSTNRYLSLLLIDNGTGEYPLHLMQRGHLQVFTVYLTFKLWRSIIGKNYNIG